MINYIASGLTCVCVGYVCVRSKKKLLQSIFISLYIHLTIKCKWSTKYSKRATVTAQSIQQISLWENQTRIVIVCCHFYADNSTDTRHEIDTHGNRFQFGKCKSKFHLHIGTLQQQTSLDRTWPKMDLLPTAPCTSNSFYCHKWCHQKTSKQEKEFGNNLLLQ